MTIVEYGKDCALNGEYKAGKITGQVLGQKCPAPFLSQWKAVIK
jgi:hypothetical protein